MKKKNEKSVNFKELDWNTVDEKKAGFFYDEALAYSNGLLVDIRSLNAKAFQLLAFVLPVFTAIVGFLIAAWENESFINFRLPGITICSGLFMVLVFLVVSVFPRFIYQSQNPPESYFSGNFYKEDMLRILSFAIASINKYIKHNYCIMLFRGRFLTAAIITLLATPLVTIAIFLARLLNQ